MGHSVCEYVYFTTPGLSNTFLTDSATRSWTSTLLDLVLIWSTGLRQSRNEELW